MAEQPSIVDTRAEQMFPKLLPDEIERLRRFGEVRRYGQGAALWRVGETGHGLLVILSGAVVVTRRDEHGRVTAIVTHGAGSFAGELGQLSGQPTLVDAHTEQPTGALIIPPERLRSLLVAEADLGERIMRALILRRVGLIQTGAGGPVIIGREDNPDVRRLITFLSRNGHPHLRLDAATDEEAAALVARFQVVPADLPIVLCPGGEILPSRWGRCRPHPSQTRTCGFAESARGVSPRAAHRSGHEPLDSSGSCHPPKTAAFR